MPIKTRPPPLSRNLEILPNMTRGDEKDMVRKIFNKAISAVTTTLLAFTTLASAIPVTTYAATTLKSKCVSNLKADAVKGFQQSYLQARRNWRIHHHSYK